MKNLVFSIPKDKLATLPAETFKGKITVVDTEDDLISALSALAGMEIIGFDTETKPSFKKGLSHTVSLLQLSGENECFLFRINKTGLHPLLISILSDPNVIKVGVSIHDDFHNLRKIADFSPAGFVDLQSEVKKYGIADNSLSRIYAILFDHRISKGQRLSNWEAPTLTVHQQAYAALDAAACLRIFRYLNDGKFNPEECRYRIQTEENTTEDEK